MSQKPQWGYHDISIHFDTYWYPYSFVKKETPTHVTSVNSVTFSEKLFYGIFNDSLYGEFFEQLNSKNPTKNFVFEPII